MFVTTLRIPPFNVRLRSSQRAVAEHLELFYAGYPRPGSDCFVDFDLRIEGGRGVHRFWRPQARFVIDDQDPFLPLPAAQAAPLFEWGLNWAVASRPLGYLVMHAAVLAQGDRAIVLPGFPGAGKSTLCASLLWLRDWRLLSDELAILDPDSGRLLPNPRPISLKNASIDIVADFPGARIGPLYADTRKGIVSHAAIPASSVAAAEHPATCRWVVFPRFRPGASASVEEIPRAEAFALISEQSFNKERMGDIGFSALCALLGGATCFGIEYGSTADGLELIDELCRSGAHPT